MAYFTLRNIVKHCSTKHVKTVHAVHTFSDDAFRRTHLFSDAKVSSDTHTSSQTHTLVLRHARSFSNAHAPSPALSGLCSRRVKQRSPPPPSPGSRPPLGLDPVHPPPGSRPHALHVFTAPDLRGSALIFIRALPGSAALELLW
ncbi:unnamed protein product [Arctogadus glacialis]